MRFPARYQGLRSSRRLSRGSASALSPGKPLPAHLRGAGPGRAAPRRLTAGPTPRARPAGSGGAGRGRHGRGKAAPWRRRGAGRAEAALPPGTLCPAAAACAALPPPPAARQRAWCLRCPRRRELLVTLELTGLNILPLRAPRLHNQDQRVTSSASPSPPAASLVPLVPGRRFLMHINSR